MSVKKFGYWEDGLARFEDGGTKEVKEYTSSVTGRSTSVVCGQQTASRDVRDSSVEWPHERPPEARPYVRRN